MSQPGSTHTLGMFGSESRERRRPEREVRSRESKGRVVLHL